MNTAGAVVLALVLLLIAAAAGWVIFTRIRASRLGLPPPPLTSYIPFLKSSSPSYGGGPSPAPGGIVGWFNDRLRALRHGRNTRTAAGAYEGGGGSSAYNAGYSGPPGGGGNNASRGFDPHNNHHLDDDAWDTRVGAYNPYEEERELGLVPPHHQGQGPYGQHAPDGDAYQMNLPLTPGGAAPRGNPAAAALQAHEEETRGRPRSRSPDPPAGGPAAARNPFGDDAETRSISLRGVSPRPMDNSFAARKAAGEGDGDRRSLFREEM